MAGLIRVYGRVVDIQGLGFVIENIHRDVH
jgi:hypothetical protein